MLVAFLNTLSATGVAEPQRGAMPEDTEDESDVILWLELARRDAARAFPGGAPPAVHPAAGLWAARWLYGAAQALVDRTLSADAVAERLALPVAHQWPDAAEVHFTVWLVLQPLAALWRGSRVLADGDVLSTCLEAVARRWPLMAPGIELRPPADAGPLRQWPTLWRLYVDRVIASGEVSALADPATADGVGEALGAHGSALAPAFAFALESALAMPLAPAIPGLATPIL
jgi:MoxR-vWA-beta-propeller ternary system domain bpX4